MSTAQSDLPDYPFRDPRVPPEQRISSLIALLTLDEKIALLSTQLGVPRLGIPITENVEGIHGLVVTGHLGGGTIDIPTTSFPQPYGMAQSWDTDLLQQVGAVIGAEARAIFQSPHDGQSKLVVMAPNADLGRDPRWGRTDECYGEDPYFNGTLAAALVRGLQGDDPDHWQVAALLKHFLANSNEDGRLASSSDFDERLLHEYYAVPFRMAIVAGGARCYMAAYNAHNGIPCTVHPMLRDMTLADWGLDGIICTDFRGMSNLVTRHQTHPDMAHAAAASIHAGISQFLDDYAGPIRAALAQQLLAEADVDAAIRRNLRVLLRLGLLDPRATTAPGAGEQAPPWTADRHQAIARRITQAGIVLLKNDRQLLPLDKNAVQSVAVVGPLADQALTDLYNSCPPYQVSPLDGIRRALGPQARLVGQTAPERPLGDQPPIGMVLEVKPGMFPPIYVPERDIPAAVELARSADVAIVCVGNNPMCGGWSMGHATPSLPSEGMEALDRQTLMLEQEALIQAVYAANPNTIVVLISSFPYAISWTAEHVPAILHMAHASQDLGNALADVLFGDVNPGGRLVQTWPRSIEQLPPMQDYDIRHGRTYMYFQGEPLYPFGYGLSYTTFAYSNLQLSAPALGADMTLMVSLDVTNTGARAGDEVVQLYVKHLNSAVERPLQELKGFRRISLDPGKTKTVTLPLTARDLACWNVNEQRFVVEYDTIEIRIGQSSNAIQAAATIDVVPAESGDCLQGGQ
ncbi:MAG TPA: glycoside hydrolase family 3 C-terminal domain-containing protein [Roseiflexaceae bacterium]|nr:glycoside hydrolase family 3 C-terminal domain-containing protein [Roseiflexaceae bacterium]